MSRVARSNVLRALDAQLAVIKEYDSPFGHKYLREFITDQLIRGVKAQNCPPAYRDVEHWGADTGEILAQGLVDNLGHAQTYYVAEDMMDLAVHAGESLPVISFSEKALPSEAGFVELSRPLIVQDANGKNIAMRAFTWWISETIGIDPDTFEEYNDRAIMIIFFTCKEDIEADWFLQEIYKDKKVLWDAVAWYHVVHWAPIRLKKDFEILPSDEEPGSIASWLAFVNTFFLLVNQEIATVVQARPDRASARRMKRANPQVSYGDVSVVTLRHTRPVNERGEMPDEQPTKYSHRWIVSGYWQNHWWPKEQVHKPTWIEAFVKGPEDLPLIVKDRVFVWKR